VEAFTRRESATHTEAASRVAAYRAAAYRAAAHRPAAPRTGPRIPHLGAYVAGVGATTALIAGALVVFLSLATFVAFRGLPLGGSGDDAGAAYLGSNGSGVGGPEAAAAALGATPGAVADPARGARAGVAGSSSTGSGDRGRASTGSRDDPGGGTPRGPIRTDPGTPASPGPARSAVGYLNETTSPLGVTVPVDPGTSGAVDGAGRRTLNRAGRGVGQRGLGDRVSGAASGLVNGLR
jgi:hypothetical protein